jgi:hypothetical protein
METVIIEKRSARADQVVKLIPGHHSRTVARGMANRFPPPQGPESRNELGERLDGVWAGFLKCHFSSVILGKLKRSVLEGANAVFRAG